MCFYVLTPCRDSQTSRTQAPPTYPKKRIGKLTLVVVVDVYSSTATHEPRVVVRVWIWLFLCRDSQTSRTQAQPICSRGGGGGVTLVVVGDVYSTRATHEPRVVVHVWICPHLCRDSQTSRTQAPPTCPKKRIGTGRSRYYCYYYW